MRTLDVEQCADFLKVDRSTILELAGRGELPGAKIGRAWVFLEDDIVEFLRSRVREQSRERLARAQITEELESRNREVPGSPLLLRRTHKRRAKLPELPELIREVAGAKVGVAP